MVTSPAATTIRITFSAINACLFQYAQCVGPAHRYDWPTPALAVFIFLDVATVMNHDCANLGQMSNSDLARFNPWEEE